MTRTADFFESVMNSMTEHIVIIDDGGLIESVNTAWVDFGIANGSHHASGNSWMGVNYLTACDVSALSGDMNGTAVAEGARRIIGGHDQVFYHEYPCHSDTEKRWFMMRITPLDWEGPSRYVISHQNITERKLAEEKVEALSLMDALTGLPNRRNFDGFLLSEWRRGLREGYPVSLLLLDVDYFKLYNDHYGHIAGDECLRQVGAALGKLGRRPGDLPARYGGEEFALIMGATGDDPAYDIACDILQMITDLAIPHEASPVGESVSASIGVATFVPNHETDMGALVEAADKALYAAKDAGRNRVEVHS